MDIVRIKPCGPSPDAKEIKTESGRRYSSHQNRRDMSQLFLVPTLRTKPMLGYCIILTRNTQKGDFEARWTVFSWLARTLYRVSFLVPPFIH